MSRSHPHSSHHSHSVPNPQLSAPQRSFRFKFFESEEGIGPILDRQAAHGKPLDLSWLLKAHHYRDSIAIKNLDVDSAQDLLLLVHYDQPHEHGAQGVTVYPVQLSNPVIPNSYGLSNAHRRARKAAINMKWGEKDSADGKGESLAVEIFLCGLHFALFVRYAYNQRVVIFNWVTGHRVARIDGSWIHTDAKASHLVEHPLDVNHFAWISPNVIMIGCISQDENDAKYDGLYLYELSGHSQQPFSRSLVLEVPRWKETYRVSVGGDKSMEIVTGSWSEDIYPGALTRNAYDRVTVVREDVSQRPGCNVFYVLRNDYMVSLLRDRNRDTLSWNEFTNGASFPCIARAFSWPNKTVSLASDIQICGSKVMIAQKDEYEQSVQVTVADFDDASLDPRLVPGTVVRSGTTVADGPDSIFEHGWLWTNLPYRLIPIAAPIEWDIKLVLGHDRVSYTRTGSWRKAGYIPVQAHLAQAGAQYQGQPRVGMGASTSSGWQ
ncbi:unnamed protein product [Peniophora sp. CBMAI 1063]|nr:unnamed protein product [Peniophora sp. CBMAI 1063]